ncbi:hypothetical protein [Thermoclostridium caenicola]|uniref:Uncharacterized protein n=1 Tax=Thermoclostridium caenicola TaxID=659425 RepID=A0A1M6EYR2_9FIRM|nr:hypothetical protein [Thermoclostridium caenicola]SHI90529.1 hypothetical protein SAMN05444373_101442 [Thermoclostridium caenicola]HOL83713.1 hypothetical protein [Thermoclostridium caenicola]HPO77672.1 hypothetical protein [Thermoclostridium caenicola]
MSVLDIGVIVFCGIVFVAALIFNHYGSKVAEELERELRNKYAKK